MILFDRIRGIVASSVVVLAIASLAACGSDDPTPPADTGADIEPGDVVPDGTGDVVPDIAPDSETDAEPDSEPDTDVTPDADAGPFCGDGNLDDGEECDDANNEDGDGCSADCLEELPDACTECESDEDCGGDTLCVELADGFFCAPACDGDACDDGEECTEILDGEDILGTVCLPSAGVCGLCGNGEVDDGEGCDDGNLDNGDGCDDACQIESFCGDGTIDDDEECDDGNNDDGDGCSSLCSEEFCGDGILHDGLGEECDDGNFDNGDGCDDECLLEPFCGDGELDDGEECDDGNNDDGDGCDAECLLEPFCGDGELDDGEECDDGNTDDGDGCSAGCEIEAFCGDGTVDDGEECDDGNTDDFDGCSSTCVVEELACPIRGLSGEGEGFLTGDTCLVGDLDRPASCGAGNSGGDYMFEYTAGASGRYTFSTVNDLREYDTTLYALSACGGEELACNDDSGETVGSSIELALVADTTVIVVVTGFAASCGFFSLDVTYEPAPVCGDGVTNGDEACDDGNTDDGDGCSSECLIELCGDGETVGIEECDDGNDIDGDGCSAECIREFCGDGIHHPGLLEDCDDGNDILGDGCTPLCQQEVCGDGEWVGLEGCDDGNLEDGDGCNSECEVEFCGDGILHEGLGEECDDGNTLNGDTCSATCLIQCFDKAIEFLSGDDVAVGDTVGQLNNHSPSCAAADGAPDATFFWRPTHSGEWTFDTHGSAFDTVLIIRDGAGEVCDGAELDCNDDSFPLVTSSVTREVAIDDEFMLVVDGSSASSEGVFTVNITAPPVPATETVPSPSADDPFDFGPRLAPFVEGDYVEYTWTTAYPSITGLDITAGLDPNFLTCDTQDFDVIINGVDVGDMDIVGGSSSQDFSFTFPAIDGPTYTVRYELNRSVEEECGAALFDYDASSATLIP